MFSQVIINTLSFNDNTDFWVTGVTGLGNPPVRQVDYDLPGENYGLFVSALYGKRTFTIKGFVKGSSMSDFVTQRDALYAACDILNGEVPITFTLANGRVLQINAVCQTVECPGQAGVVVGSTFSAQFKASFPFFVVPPLQQYNIALPIGGGGTVPAPTMPMALGGNQGGSLTITNNGNAPFWPTATIYGPVTNPQITNVTQGLSLLFAITLTSGQYIKIDFKRKTVYDNFGTNQYGTKSGDWFYFPKGPTLLSFSASSTTPGALLTLFAQDCYLAV